MALREIHIYDFESGQELEVAQAILVGDYYEFDGETRRVHVDKVSFDLGERFIDNRDVEAMPTVNPVPNPETGELVYPHWDSDGNPINSDGKPA